MSRTVRLRTGAQPHLPLLVVVAGGVTLAAVGAALAVGMLATSRVAPGEAPAFGVGRDAPTSFGSISVQEIALTDGLSAADLGGMTHGVTSLVPPDKLQVQVSLLLTNGTARSVDFAPARQFRLVSAAGVEAEQVRGGLGDGDRALPGHSSLATVLRFNAPRLTDDDLFLEFFDPGQARLVRIRVGPNNRAPPGELESSPDHTH